ncbi:MAG: YdeI/OmpD-associated family protein [Pseudomonadota bacterium]
MTIYPHSFEAPIVEHWFEDKFAYKVVWLPADIAAALPFKTYPRLRVVGEMADHPFKGACMPVRGVWYLMVSPAIMKAAELSLGDEIEVRFDIDDQTAVDIPPALATALREDSAFGDLWAALTPGKQRGFAHRVAAAKRPETIKKRLAEIREALSE